MPSNVARFEILFYTSVVLGVLTFLLDAKHVSQKAEASFLFIGIVLVLTFGLLVLLVWLSARRRKNWARWVVFIVFLLGLVPFLFSLPEMFTSSMLRGSVATVQMILQSVAIYLVFTGNAKPWFEKQPAA